MKEDTENPTTDQKPLAALLTQEAPFSAAFLPKEAPSALALMTREDQPAVVSATDTQAGLVAKPMSPPGHPRKIRGMARR